MARLVAGFLSYPVTVCSETDVMRLERELRISLEERAMAASIYESIGGADAVAAAVDKFYDRVLGDPDLAPYFTGYAVSGIKRHQRACLTAALGGAELYEGRDMAAAHGHLGVTDEHFDRVVVHLVATLTDLNVPGDIIGEIGAKLAPLKPQIVSA